MLLNLFLINAETVLRSNLECIGVRTKHLSIKSAPLRVVDAIDPILHFEDQAAVLLNDTLAAWNTLCLLQWHGSVLLHTAVDLEGVLVGEDLQLDTGGSGSKSGNGLTEPARTWGKRWLFAEGVDVAGICVR